MNNEKNQLTDNELENISGGVYDLPGSGGTCPINGKYCRHYLPCHAGNGCLHAVEGAGITPRELARDENGNEVVTGGEEYTYYQCSYINDQE